MADDESSSEKGSSEQERKIARQRDAFLADARGEKTPANSGGGTDPRLMGLGVQFVIAILLCVYAGMWVDTKLRTTPWFTLIGGLLGAAAGFYSMVRVAMDANKKDEEEQKQKKSDHRQ